MGYISAIKSGFKACEGLFAKAPLRHTVPEGFVKAAKAGEVKICPNFLEGKVGDVVELGNCTKATKNINPVEQTLNSIGDGESIINCNTNQEATELAQKIVMKQFKKPLSEQCERLIAVNDSKIYIGSVGVETKCGFHSKIQQLALQDFTEQKFVSYHNHPYHRDLDGTFPLSGSDIGSLTLKPVRSVTAFNSAGEHCTAEIIDISDLMAQCNNDKLIAFVKLNKAIRQECQISIMGAEGKRLLELRKLQKSQTLSEKLENELQILEEKCNNIHVDDYISSAPKLYAVSMHKALKKVLPQYGIKYETNFSNLAGI